MELLSPHSLLWLLPVLGSILILYLLRMRRQDFRVPAAFLWPSMTSDVRANAPFQKLRFSLLLLLQLIAAALVILALAGPLKRVKGFAGKATVLVLDASAPMSATDGSPTRFDAARARVESLITSTGPQDRLALIEAASTTKIVFPFTSNHAIMANALRNVMATDAPGQMGDALRLASALTTGRPRSRILVLSDGDFPAVTDFSPGGAQVSYESFGKSTRNVGIIAFDSALAANGSVQCFASIHNYDSAPATASVTVSVDGRITDARSVRIPADSSTGEIFTASPSARAAHISVDSPGDILASDNQATIYLKGAGTVRTLLVSGGNLFLERALSLDPSVTLERAPVLPDYERAETPGAGRYDMVVFDNVQPQPVKAPAVWSFGIPGKELGVSDRGICHSPASLDWDRTDAIMRYTDFHDISIASAHKVELDPGAGAKQLLEGSGGPLIVSATPRDKRSLYVAWNILDSDFPLQVSFPIFVGNAVSWLATGASRSTGDAGGITAHPGETFTIASPGVSVNLTHPDGSTETLDGSTGVATIRSADLVGVYSARSGDARTDIAVNLLNEDAGNVTPRPQLDLAGSTVEGVRHSEISLSELWRPIVVAALLVMAAEWWVFVKRS